MKWTTWKGIGVDRMACIWLIRRFIDPTAQFHFIDEGTEPSGNVGTPFDIPGTGFSHRGSHCSFHTLVTEHRLSDATLLRIARIVDEADIVQDVALEPAAQGLDLLCRGLRRTAKDDNEAIDRALLVYDALYAELKAESAPPFPTAQP